MALQYLNNNTELDVARIPQKHV